MSIEGLGQKFQDARIARGLSLDDAARLTKIRPSRLQEIEAEDFSNFPSLAYARGFLLIYGKFLNVEVDSSLEAFEDSSSMTVDGYSYLQDNPAPPPPRTVVRQARTNQTSLLPLLIALGVLIGGFWVIKLVRDIQRTTPSRSSAVATPTPTPSPNNIVAPRALPVAGTTPPRVTATSPAPSATATPPAIASFSPATQAPPSEPEVRRAEPVRPDDLKNLTAAATPAPAPSPSASASPPGPPRVEVRTRRRTYLKVFVGRNAVFERWVEPGEALRFRGPNVVVQALDPSAIEVRRNGK